MKQFLIILTTLFLTSCYQEIDLDKYRNEEGENIVTLNAIINPDSVVQAYATRTYFYTDGHSKPKYIDSLNIELWINDKFIQTMTFNDSIYESKSYPKAGDRVHLRTKFLNQEITATNIIPKQVEIESIEATLEGPIHIFWEDDMVYTYYITFTDDPNEENYYFLRFIEPYFSRPIDGLNFDGEYVFQQLKQQINDIMPGYELNPYRGLPFSDTGINGNTHTLIVKEIDQEGASRYGKKPYPNEKPIKIQLFAISKDYYYYLVDVARVQGDSGISSGLIDIGAAEPIKIFSNIDGGVGIMGAYNLSEKCVDIIQIMEIK